MGAAVNLQEANFQEAIDKGVTLVDFWAPWCGPCKTQGPIIDELAGELEGKVTVAKVNVDDHGAIAEKYGISGIPTMILFKDGQPLDKLVGLQSKDALTNKINNAL